MENEILTQLIWIKWLLVIVVIFIFVGAVALSVLAKVFSKIPEQMKNELSFPDRAKVLLDQGNSEVLIRVAEERVLNFPADSYAHWYLGQAYYRVGDLHRALICLRKTQELQPDWESTYIAPLIRVIEEKLTEGSAKPELKLVTPIPSFERVAPPDGDSPLKS